MNHERTFRVLGISALVLLLVVVMGIWHLGANPMVACGFIGAVFLHFGTRPDRHEVLTAVTIGAGYGLIYYLLGSPFGRDFFSLLLGAGAFAGLGSMTVLAYRALWFRSEPDITALKDSSILPLFLAGSGLVVGLAERLWPKTFDLYLYAFDCSLGISPGPAVAGWWKHVPLLGVLCTATYAVLLFFPPLYRAWAVRSGLGREPSVLRAFLVAGLLGFVLYQCCPAAGPRYVFAGNFPGNLPNPDNLMVGLTAVPGTRTAMPAIQTTWALLVWWSAWRLGWAARGVATLVVVLTLLTALGSGEHYFVDLIVAVPFALAVDGLCRGRQAAMGVGFGLTVGWLILLRSGYRPTPELGWILVAVTILGTVACQISLYRGKHTDDGLALSSRLTAMGRTRLVPENKR